MGSTGPGSNFICHCKGELEICEELSVVHPIGYGEIKYMLEFHICVNCGKDYVFKDSIIKNDARLTQAKLESTVAYKMKKWITS